MDIPGVHRPRRAHTKAYNTHCTFAILSEVLYIDVELCVHARRAVPVRVPRVSSAWQPGVHVRGLLIGAQWYFVDAASHKLAGSVTQCRVTRAKGSHGRRWHQQRVAQQA